MKKSIIGVITMLCLIILLNRCVTDSSSKIIPFSKAIEKGRTIWYVASKEENIKRDGYIEEIYVLENN